MASERHTLGSIDRELLAANLGTDDQMFDRMVASLDAKMQQRDAEFSAQMQQRDAEFSAQMQQMQQAISDLSGQMQQSNAELREEMQQAISDLSRKMQRMEDRITLNELKADESLIAHRAELARDQALQTQGWAAGRGPGRLSTTPTGNRFKGGGSRMRPQPPYSF